MARAAKAWERRVREHFDFLVGHGFRFDHVEAKWWATTARYLSPTLGLEVTRSVEFDRVEITLLRLVEGELPEYEVWVTDSPRNRVLFDNVLIARAPEVDEASRALGGLSKEDEEKQLRFWADALRSVAPDFLEGDDAPLREGEQVVRQRVAENPQELTIWLPSDASQEEEDRAREKARGDSAAQRRGLSEALPSLIPTQRTDGSQDAIGGKTFQSLKGAALKAKYLDVETGDQNWISSCRKGRVRLALRRGRPGLHRRRRA